MLRFDGENAATSFLGALKSIPELRRRPKFASEQNAWGIATPDVLTFAITESPCQSAR